MKGRSRTRAWTSGTGSGLSPDPAVGGGFEPGLSSVQQGLHRAHPASAPAPRGLHPMGFSEGDARLSAMSGNSDTPLELASAAVLAVAALITSWAGYQASLWDGEQAAHYSRANALRIEASRAALSADTRQAVEIGMFFQWLDAEARQDRALASFYRSRLPPDLRPAFNEWLRDDPFTNESAAPTPFSQPVYRTQGRSRAAELDRAAMETFERGQRDNAISDAFTQGSTIVSTAMFFAGIGQIFRVRVARVGLLAMAILAITLGVMRLAALPVQVLGFGPPG